MHCNILYSQSGIPVGYALTIPAADSIRWAERPGDIWPCSTLAGCRVRVEVDSNGLYGISVDGEPDTEVDGSELEALIADFLPPVLHHLWPTREPRE